MPYNLKKQGMPMRRGDHLKDWREYNTGISSIHVYLLASIFVVDITITVLGYVNLWIMNVSIQWREPLLHRYLLVQFSSLEMVVL